MLKFKPARGLSCAVVALLVLGCDSDSPDASGSETSSGATETMTPAETSTGNVPPGTGGEESSGGATTTGMVPTTTDASTSDGTTDATTGGEPTTGDTEDMTSSGGETGGRDVDTVCDPGKATQECEMPSMYDGPGECDPFAQDCADGERCVPWNNAGGANWNATRCSPVDDNPAQIGDACTVEGSGVSGVDTCDVGLMCWDVDPDTNMGTCIELCGCGPGEPTCSGGGTVCTVSNGGVLPICLQTCDPLDPGAVCGDSEGCYPVDDSFLCAPDASVDGVVGESCSSINGCAAGMACLNPDSVPGCFAVSGCCSAFCDLDEPNACGDGWVCDPWYPVGEEPLSCHVDTGICVEA